MDEVEEDEAEEGKCPVVVLIAARTSMECYDDAGWGSPRADGALRRAQPVPTTQGLMRPPITTSSKPKVVNDSLCRIVMTSLIKKKKCDD